LGYRICGSVQCRPQVNGQILEQLGSTTKAAAVERAQFNTSLQQSLELFPGGLAGLGAEAMVALLDAQGSVGLGDQLVAVDQGVDAALRKPVECQRAAVLWSQQGHHHARFELDHRLASVTSAHRCGSPQLPLG
jgi:hypothetical protein